MDDDRLGSCLLLLMVLVCVAALAYVLAWSFL